MSGEDDVKPIPTKVWEGEVGEKRYRVILTNTVLVQEEGTDEIGAEVWTKVSPYRDIYMAAYNIRDHWMEAILAALRELAIPHTEVEA